MADGLTVNILTVVPARAGSKGVPGKNLRPLAGVPLIAHILRTIAKSRFPQRVIVSTDSQGIAEIACAEGAEAPFMRPAHLAGDEVPITPVIAHALEHESARGSPPDIVVSLQPTCPLLEIASIDSALARIVDDATVDSVVSTTLIRKCHPFRSYRLGDGSLLEPLTEYTTEKYLQKQDRPPAYGLTGGFYMRRRRLLEQPARQGFALGERCIGQVVSEEEAVDIDSEVDFQLAEAILKSRRARSAIV